MFAYSPRRRLILSGCRCRLFRQRDHRCCSIPIHCLLRSPRPLTPWRFRRVPCRSGCARSGRSPSTVGKLATRVGLVESSEMRSRVAVAVFFSASAAVSGWAERPAISCPQTPLPAPKRKKITTPRMDSREASLWSNRVRSGRKRLTAP